MQEHMINKPIPNGAEISWDMVYSTPLIDCGEELVPLSLAPEQMLVRSVYFEAGLAGALPECYARVGVRERLVEAAKLLPNYLRFVILDVWRGQQVQKALFQQCKSALTISNPNADERKLNIMTQQYVALPSLDMLAPSPHSTGGAVDLMIATRDGNPMFFGSPFDYPSEISYTRYFEKKLENKEDLSKRENDAMQNRRLLYNIMKAAGFVNFSCEWWHYEYGTQRWANETNKEHAIYGSTSVCLNSFEIFEKSEHNI